jgi:hypothetical protein
VSLGARAWRSAACRADASASNSSNWSSRGEDLVVPLHVVEQGCGDAPRGRGHEAGCPEPGVERRGLAEAELAKDGALQAGSERGCGGEPETGAHGHPEDADVHVVGEPQTRERGDGFQPMSFDMYWPDTILG